MCECSGVKFPSDYNTEVCWECGLETSVGYNMFQPNANVYNTHTPFLQGYSRQKRFATMLDCVISPSPYSADNNALKYMLPHKGVEKVGDIFTLLKKHRSKDKRYCSVHLFTRLLCPGYVPTKLVPYEVRRKILHKFRDMEFLHRRFVNHKPFFSYCWLIRKFLQNEGLTEFLPYVKKLKCKKRCKVYEDLYVELLKHSRTDAPISAYV